jgi:hypothetical protein
VLAAVCGRALSWRSTTPDVSIPRLLFWMVLHSVFRVSKYTYSVSVVACCVNSTISRRFLSQKTVATSVLADKVCLSFCCFFLEYVCIHSFDWVLVSSAVSRRMWLRNSSQWLLYRSKNVYEIQRHSRRFVGTCEHFHTPWVSIT